MEETSDLGLLGKQIMLAITAFGAAPDTALYCAVRDDYFRADELLTGDGRRKFLAYDSLPGSEDIKSIGIDENTLLLELSPCDVETLLTYADELPNGVSFRNDGVYLGRRKLAHLAKPKMKPDEIHGTRVLWMIDWPKLGPQELRTVVEVFDLADTVGAYESDLGVDEGVTPVAYGKKPSLEMRLGLQFQLIQEQVPILALRIEPRDEQRTEQRLELTLEQTLRFERWLERNPEEAIEEYLANHPTPQGARHLASLIQFKLARDVKKIAEREGKPIDWPEARRIVRKIARRQSAA